MKKENLNKIYTDLFNNDECPDWSLCGSDKSAETEIKRIFQECGKLACFVSLEHSKIPLTRTYHSVSVYLLGLYLLQNWTITCHNNNLFTYNFFDFFVKKYGIDLSKFEFETNPNLALPKDFDGINYIWTLTSLYHDVITNRESAELAKLINTADNPFITPVSFFNFTGFFKNSLRYTVFENHPEIERVLKENKSLTTKSNSLVPTYCEETINAYFRKRLHDGCIDHGIASGFVFYDALVKNYLGKEQEQSTRKESDGSFSKDLSGNSGSVRLTYRPEHLLLFKYIADAIIAHNIWRYNAGTQSEYAIYGLTKDAKMQAGQNKFTIQDNPLVFFLCLVDTIEPTKYFYHISAKELLAGINFELSEM